MRCLTPFYRKDDKLSLTRLVNDKATLYTPVPCGNCVNCLKRKTDEWISRLSIACYQNYTCKFVTYTYDDEHLPLNGVSKRDIQLLHKRMRKVLTGCFPKMKYIVISEYGPTGHRPHYHGIYFDCPEYLFDMWDKGFVTVDDVLPERIAYIASYHILKNFFVPGGLNPNFKFSSNFLGLDNFNAFEYDNAVSNDWRFLFDKDGVRHVLPRYFRKIYDIKLPSQLPSFSKEMVKDIVDFKNFNSQVRAATALYIKRKMINKKNI